MSTSVRRNVSGFERRPRLLVAEDDEDARLAYSVLLRGRYDLDLEDCASNALRRFEVERPDLIVVDYALPDVSGVRLVEAIRESWPDIPPAIMVSAYPDRRELCSQYGIEAFVAKPFRTLDLVWAIERVLAQAESR